MTTARGVHAHPTRKLGRRPEDKSKPKLAFADFVATVPDHPLVDAQPAFSYPMDHNDQVGDCVVAGGDHVLEVIGRSLTGGYSNWSDAFMLAAYQTQNPGFRSWADGGGPNDGGMVVAEFLSWLVAQKLVLGYAKVDTSNPEEIKAAIYLGLGIITGEDLRAAQQSGNVWDYVAGSPDWGGHCTVWSGYDASGFSTVSWGSDGYVMTPAFVKNQVDEAYFVLTQAHVDHPSFRAGFDLAKFADAVKQITGGKVIVPVGPPSPPTPPSPASDADKVLAQASRDWVENHRHSGEAATVAAALKVWLASKGLT